MPRFKLSEERENLFSLYQVIYPNVLSTLVDSKAYRLEQEFPFKGKKIDIYGSLGEIHQNIYVEVQLIPADIRHMEKVKRIISDIDYGGIVVWEALSFEGREHLVKEVVEFACSLKKPLDILFLEVNPSVIPVLEELKKHYPLDVIPNLGRLAQVRELFEKVAEWRGRNLLGEALDSELEASNGSKRHDIDESVQLEPMILSTRLGANQYVLKCIRKEIPFYPGGYRAKSRLGTNAITFGAGDGNTFEISVRDDYSHVKLRIPKKNGRAWIQLKMDKMMIENRIGFGIYLRAERSSYILDVPVKSLGRIRTEVLDEVVVKFKKFVEFFTEYFYLRENEEWGN